MIRVVISVLLLLPGLAFAQTREKPKLKDFGSSLKKLKWDAQKNQTTETGTRSADDDEVIRIETALVSSELLVLDKQGRPVQGLTQSDFLITEEGAPQQVGHFLLGDNRSLPRSIVLIIDYSGSQFPYIKDSVEAASVLVDKLGPLDRMAIVTDDVEVLCDFTNDKRELKKKLNTLLEKSRGNEGFLGIGGTRRQFGKSAQYSALLATLKEAFDDEDQRPIIVFQTDGDEAEYLRNSIIVPMVPPDLPPQMVAVVQNQIEQRRQLQRSSMTEFSLEDVYRAVEKSRATIYTVVPGAKLIGLTPQQQLATVMAEDERAINEMLPTLSKKAREAFIARQDARKRVVPMQVLQMRAEENAKLQEALAAVAPLSGGWTEFLEQPAQAQGIYTRILSDISQRYIVGYYPTNKERDGKRRRITFEVKGHPEYNILGRRSYFAPGVE
ncbi:MAG TPA: VWA domain-containing protein [Pyrinomonadaceae bacterium]|nr:VWA domain-containing protein [Pyrinomonadaceae bacterium]